MLRIIIRLHCLHKVHRCRLWLQMSLVGWSVCLSVYVCVGHMGELCKIG